VWGKCEKPKSGKNVKKSHGNFLEKKCGKKLALKKRG
jgi:hypothetical protein